MRNVRCIPLPSNFFQLWCLTRECLGERVGEPMAQVVSIWDLEDKILCGAGKEPFSPVLQGTLLPP